MGRTGRAGREGVAITLAEPRESRLLHNIEQHTRRKIVIEAVPSVHDLRARRLEITRDALTEAIEAGGLDAFRSIVESLASEHDVFDVAAAAVKLVDGARDGAMSGEEDIAKVESAPRRPERTFSAARAIPSSERSGPRLRPKSSDVTRIYIGVGRSAGIRPADLVGAIANEARISSRDIGHIDIADRFSLVEVPGQAADAIIVALRGASIRGKKVLVRRDRDV